MYKICIETGVRRDVITNTNKLLSVCISHSTNITFKTNHSKTYSPSTIRLHKPLNQPTKRSNTNSIRSPTELSIEFFTTHNPFDSPAHSPPDSQNPTELIIHHHVRITYSQSSGSPRIAKKTRTARWGVICASITHSVQCGASSTMHELHPIDADRKSAHIAMAILCTSECTRVLCECVCV